MRIVIERGIPIPYSRKDVWEELVDALRTMAPGDSFVIEKHLVANLRNRCKVAGIKICTRSIEAENDMRVWKV